METNYPSNSRKSKVSGTPDNTIPDKKVEKVVKGTVKKKKKSEISKCKDVFISEDINSVTSSVFLAVLVPSIKKALLDIVTDGANMILYGDKRGGNNRGVSSRVSYRDYSGSGKREQPVSRRDNYDYADLVYDSRGEAEDVLNGMDDLIARYGVVTVADMCDLSGVTCRYPDNKYGWMNINSAQVVHGRDGYMIKMPKAVPID